MTRTYTQVSHTARTLGIAGLIICASFLAYAAPASATTSTGGMSVGTHQIGGGGMSGHGDGMHAPMKKGGQNDKRPTSSSEGGVGDSQHPQWSEADQIEHLEERVKNLDEMKAQLQKLIASLANSSSTLSHRPECSLHKVGTSTSSHTKRVKGTSPFNCRVMSNSSSTPSWGTGFDGHMKNMYGTSTPSVRPSDDSTTKKCAAGDPRRCQDVFPKPRMHGGGGNSGHATSSPFGGRVLGASTDLEAEFAASLDDLRGALIDLGDDLSS